MAGGGVHHVHTLNPNRQNYEGTFTLYVLIACIVAASGGLIFGYDIGISGGVTSMDEFLLKFFPDVYRQKHVAQESDYCKYDNQFLQLFTSSLYIAGLCAAFPASYTTRTLGRKRTMLIGGISFFIGAVLNGSAQNLAMLIIGRILLGVGVGFANQSVPLYLSEMAPANYRGALNILFQFATTIGIMVANLINYVTSKHVHGWRYSLGLAVVPAIMLILGGLFCPETPNSLIERGHIQEGRRVLEKIRGVKTVDAELDDIIEASEIAKEVKHPFRNLLNMNYRPQLSLAIIIPILQQLTGINVIMFYAPVLFNTLGFEADASLYSAVIIGVVNIVATIISIVIVDRYGRRPLFLQGGLQMIVCQIGVAIILALQFGGTKVLPKASGSGVLTLVCLFVAAFAWSWGPLGWLVPSEIFPMEIRSAGQAIVVSMNLLMTFIIAQAFLTILCHFQYGSFLFFAGWEVIMTIFIFFFLPETKNVPIEEVVLVWRSHWFWKRTIPAEDKVEVAL